MSTAHRPARTSVWEVQDWTQPKTVRRYAREEDAKTATEHLVRVHHQLDNTVKVRWDYECCAGEGCNRCFDVDPHAIEGAILNAVWDDPQDGTRCADYRLLEVFVYQEPDACGLTA